MLKKLFASLPLVLVLLAAGLAAAAPLPVAVSIPPQKWLAEQIGGSLIKVQVLLDKTRDPHSFELAPDQIAALFHSQIYFSVGLEFERELLRKISQSPSKVRVADSTAGIKKIAIAEHGHHDHHDHSSFDPHVWLDPQNARQMAEVMAKTLAEADPANAAAYQQNAQAVARALTALHEELKAKLAPFNERAFLVYHPAFGYFAKAYGLRQESVEMEGKSPSSRQLHALIGKAKEERTRAIFVQPQFDRKNAETIAQAIGASVEVLDDMAEDMPSGLRQMAEQISKALGRE